ncbi:MAG: hypothetical protein IM600_09435 [Bacteroidetes bacterium]|jgi:YVTN family beta-propeller protein|nr:hypothetical protein [Bacteroidota bacterium]MCA6443635.1 hypothetical protein [Bacteroidota bacterium]
MMRLITYCFLLLSFTACVKDKPTMVPKETIHLSVAKKVFIINEGGLNDNKASISLFDPGTNQVVENYYGAQNNNQVLGSIAQSLTYFQSNYYIVINNSNKVVVCDYQFKKTGQISGLMSPRYFLPVSNQKAYVSDLYANQIHIIDLGTNTKTGSIACPGWTEQMVLLYNKVFVCNYRKDYLYVINATTNLISDSIPVGKNAGSLVIDRFDNLWVLSSGESTNAVPAKLSKIDPISHNILKTYTFQLNESPNSLCLNKGKDSIYFINKNIYRMRVSDSDLPTTPFVVAGSKVFYGLGVNPTNYNIYVADAVDYVQKSNVFIYNTSGELTYNFKAGINANGFYFES